MTNPEINLQVARCEITGMQVMLDIHRAEIVALRVSLKQCFDEIIRLKPQADSGGKSYRYNSLAATSADDTLARTPASYIGKTVIGVEELAGLKAAREADFEIFHAIRMKLTELCGDPYLLHDEALVKIEANLIALRKDRERLDWLESEGHRAFGWDTRWTDQGAACFALIQSPHSMNATPRAAIDAAIDSQKEGKL